jgi:hypothetical protein
MRKSLRITAALLALGSVVFWLATGANRGWTKTNIPRPIVDEVTGIESRVYEKGFVPGVDFLAGALGVTLALAGCSFFFRKKSVGR